jgi:hypothetical protein
MPTAEALEKGWVWYRCHVRFPTSTGAADVHFHLQAAPKHHDPKQFEDADMAATAYVEELIPSICENNFTTWTVPDPDYVPSKAIEWWREEDT